MTAIELNAQIWRDMAEIADSEPISSGKDSWHKRFSQLSELKGDGSN